MKLKITITAGIGFDKLNRPVVPCVRDVAVERAAESLSINFGGCTVTQGLGSFKNAAGKLVVEPCVVLVALVAAGNLPSELSVNTARAIARELRDDLNQESVAFSVEEVCAIEFI